jgi:hypothetical protein
MLHSSIRPHECLELADSVGGMTSMHPSHAAGGRSEGRIVAADRVTLTDGRVEFSCKVEDPNQLHLDWTEERVVAFDTAKILQGLIESAL